MEREILVANTKTQQRTKINSSATTLGELKEELTKAGIDYSDMTFTEGISKSQLLDDATQLPHNLMYKGQQTNNLVIILTNTKKKIASGMDRKEAYALIKKYNLQDMVKKEYGRNYTQISTEDLADIIAANKAPIADESESEDASSIQDVDFMDDVTEFEAVENNKATICESIGYHIATCVENGIFKMEDLKNLKDVIEMLIDGLEDEKVERQSPVSTSTGNISDDDIDDMINDIM